MTIKDLRTIAVQVIVLNLIASFFKFCLDGYYSKNDIPGK